MRWRSKAHARRHSKNVFPKVRHLKTPISGKNTRKAGCSQSEALPPFADGHNLVPAFFENLTYVSASSQTYCRGVSLTPALSQRERGPEGKGARVLPE